MYGRKRGDGVHSVGDFFLNATEEALEAKNEFVAEHAAEVFGSSNTATALAIPGQAAVKLVKFSRAYDAANKSGSTNPIQDAFAKVASDHVVDSAISAALPTVSIVTKVSNVVAPIADAGAQWCQDGIDAHLAKGNEWDSHCEGLAEMKALMSLPGLVKRAKNRGVELVISSSKAVWKEITSPPTADSLEANKFVPGSRMYRLHHGLPVKSPSTNVEPSFGSSAGAGAGAGSSNLVAKKTLPSANQLRDYVHNNLEAYSSSGGMASFRDYSDEATGTYSGFGACIRPHDKDGRFNPNDLQSTFFAVDPKSGRGIRCSSYYDTVTQSVQRQYDFANCTEADKARILESDAFTRAQEGADRLALERFKEAGQLEPLKWLKDYGRDWERVGAMLDKALPRVPHAAIEVGGTRLDMSPINLPCGAFSVAYSKTDTGTNMAVSIPLGKGFGLFHAQTDTGFSRSGLEFGLGEVGLTLTKNPRGDLSFGLESNRNKAHLLGALATGLWAGGPAGWTLAIGAAGVMAIQDRMAFPKTVDGLRGAAQKGWTDHTREIAEYLDIPEEHKQAMFDYASYQRANGHLESATGSRWKSVDEWCHRFLHSRDHDFRRAEEGLDDLIHGTGTTAHLPKAKTLSHVRAEQSALANTLMLEECGKFGATVGDFGYHSGRVTSETKHFKGAAKRAKDVLAWVKKVKAYAIRTTGTASTEFETMCGSIRKYANECLERVEDSDHPQAHIMRQECRLLLKEMDGSEAVPITIPVTEAEASAAYRPMLSHEETASARARTLAQRSAESIDRGKVSKAIEQFDQAVSHVPTVESKVHLHALHSDLEKYGSRILLKQIDGMHKAGERLDHRHEDLNSLLSFVDKHHAAILTNPKALPGFLASYDISQDQLKERLQGMVKQLGEQKHPKAKKAAAVLDWLSQSFDGASKATFNQYSEAKEKARIEQVQRAKREAETRLKAAKERAEAAKAKAIAKRPPFERMKPSKGLEVATVVASGAACAAACWSAYQSHQALGEVRAQRREDEHRHAEAMATIRVAAPAMPPAPVPAWRREAVLVAGTIAEQRAARAARRGQAHHQTMLGNI